MRWFSRFPGRRACLALGLLPLAGCGGLHEELAGYPPLMPPLPVDAQAAVAVAVAPQGAQPAAPAPAPAPGKPGKEPIRLPPELPGAGTPPLSLPRLADLPAAEREQRLQAIYPAAAPTPGAPAPQVPPEGQPWTLADLQRHALEHSPVLRRAAAEEEAARGALIQAGLCPNPTVGFQADQIHPGQDAGQQGLFINQVIRAPGKLSLAQAVAAMDYLNARVAHRRAQIDLANQVRTQFFAVQVAREGIAVNQALVKWTEEAYRLQIKQVGGGETAGYEPLQIFALAAQARNSLAQAETRYLSAWRQLAAALGDPALPPTQLAGRADAAPPDLDIVPLSQHLLADHTDLLTALNTIVQAQYSLRQAELAPVPDVTANLALQHDFAARQFQYSLQLGVPLPIFDKNQGNVLQARAQLTRANEDLAARRNDLLGRLAEAHGRYAANRAIVRTFRDQVIPNLVRAYRLIYQRYQQEEKVSFSDVIVAQQNLAQAYGSYLGALNDLWTAVVDVAAAAQIDDLYCPAVPPAAPGAETPAAPAPAPEPIRARPRPVP